MKNNETNDTDPKLIEYPCRWLYKIIGTEKSILEKAVLRIVQDDTATLTVSNRSRGGKYISLSLEVHVQDEETRNSLYVALKQDPAVKIVL